MQDAFGEPLEILKRFRCWKRPQFEPLVEEGQKVLVFSQFVEMLGLIRTSVAERGWRIFYLDGATEEIGRAHV